MISYVGLRQIKIQSSIQRFIVQGFKYLNASQIIIGKYTAYIVSK